MTDPGAGPLSNPTWQALARECSLIRQLLGAGATALGKASYADHEGYYYVAFFGLSLGIERLAKMILIADYVWANSGALPKDKEIKRLGHRIEDLLERVDEIGKRRDFHLSHRRPNDKISRAIVSCLDSFADAKRGRYANLQFVVEPKFTAQFEPISRWWRLVAEPILAKHYKGTAQEPRVNKNAALINRSVEGVAIVLHRTETGEVMRDIETASVRTGQTRIIQRYGRYYTLRIVRWMAEIFSELSRDGGYVHGFGVLFGHHEHFYTFTVDEDFLKRRKVWPLI